MAPAQQEMLTVGTLKLELIETMPLVPLLG
jgi:hypothetical protein